MEYMRKKVTNEKEHIYLLFSSPSIKSVSEEPFPSRLSRFVLGIRDEIRMQCDNSTHDSEIYYQISVVSRGA